MGQQRRPQVQDGLGGFGIPAHPGSFEPVGDQVLAIRRGTRSEGLNLYRGDPLQGRAVQADVPDAPLVPAPGVEVDAVLTEGGPTLLGQLIAGQLLDELCLTISPLLAGGGHLPMVAGASLDIPQVMRMVHVLEEDGALFCRYARAGK